MEKVGSSHSGGVCEGPIFLVAAVEILSTKKKAADEAAFFFFRALSS
jgi:hypothetical protein